MNPKKILIALLLIPIGISAVVNSSRPKETQEEAKIAPEVTTQPVVTCPQAKGELAYAQRQYEIYSAGQLLRKSEPGWLSSREAHSYLKDFTTAEDKVREVCQ